MKKDKNKYIKFLENEVDILKRAIKESDSYLDLATDLYKRDLFETHKESIANIIIKDKKKNIPWSILFCDINKLKQVNDSFGHAEGDKGIKFIASIIKELTRFSKRNDCIPKDIIINFNNEDTSLSFRLGGDEFIVLLPCCSKKNAEKIAKRIRNKIDSSSLENTKGLSLAIGVADSLKIKLEKDSEENSIFFLNNLISLADSNMYKDKIKQTKKLSLEVKNEYLKETLHRVAQYYHLNIYDEKDFMKFKKIINELEIKGK